MSANKFPLSYLVPNAPTFLEGFTTCEHLDSSPDNLEVVPIQSGDHSLGVHKVSSGTTHNLVNPPASLSKFKAPAVAWEALYPKGSINPSGSIPGGFGFYLSGPPAFAKRLESATEAIFSYRMMLQDGWEWVKGGKLPGVYGGVGDLAYGCTGGRKEKRCQCFNLRPMWRPKSIGELYTYLPLTPSNETQLSSVPPLSIANPDYGFSVGRGSFSFQPAVGNWMALAFRVQLNDVGLDNGELELYVDGRSVLRADGLSLRKSDAGKIGGMHFQTFFGGHSQDWASPKDQRAWFADVTGVILR